MSIKRLAIFTLIIVILASSWIAYTYWFRAGSTPLNLYRPPVCAEILDRNGKVLDYACPFNGIRFWKSIDSIDRKLSKLVIMLEDAKFYEHEGIDFDAVVDAVETDIKRGKFAKGGSTITQQLAKNLFLSKEKSLVRKASEVPLTLRLEKELSKRQILELYLNVIEWGPGIYGAEAASRVYFDHSSQELKNEEAWLLALMIPNPKELNLWFAPRAKKSLLKRAKTLMNRIVSEKDVTNEEGNLLLNQFQNFLDSWATLKPQFNWDKRESFPVHHPSFFNLESLPKLKQAALKAKDRKLITTLDHSTQRMLETKLNLVTSKVLKDKYFVVLQENEVHAIAPARELTETQSFELGMEVKLFSGTDLKNLKLY